MVELASYQLDAINKLKTGSILVGGVGTGKSRTALAYFVIKECEGSVPINGKGKLLKMKKPKDLYIITTARKRDSSEWDKEAMPFYIYKDINSSYNKINFKVDSWNNISKYVNVENAFFIFDEQRVVGYGSWSKSFIKITKRNNWILLSATPGDTWSDYIPVFIANGFYKNKTDFERKHVVYSRITKYPKIDRYVDTGILVKHRLDILVEMKSPFKIKTNKKYIMVNYDKELYNLASIKRWNPYTNKPIKESGEYCYTLRRIVNSDENRFFDILELWKKHPRIIIFYNFDYELEILRKLSEFGPVSEWNGHKHLDIPDTDRWCYLAQYNSCAEGWNCIETNTIVFYSLNYSYKMTVQAEGRVNRMNTPFKELYYYYFKSPSSIDLAILRSLKRKETFNERDFDKG